MVISALECTSTKSILIARLLRVLGMLSISRSENLSEILGMKRRLAATGSTLYLLAYIPSQLVANVIIIFQGLLSDDISRIV